jgi:type 1 glutamine amidotransferase
LIRSVRRNLILTGGHSHTFAVAAPALAGLLAGHGIESTIDDDIEGALAGMDARRPDLLTVYALRWSMKGEKYDSYRARWAFELSQEGRDAIETHLARGGGLLALHTAIICFDGWAAWKDILGGTWVWGRSNHPPSGPVEVEPSDPGHALVRGVDGFALDDEVYGDLDFVPGVVPLLRARAGGGGWHPVLWTRRVGPARVAVDLLGHDATAFEHAEHGRIVARAALWATGSTDTEVARV